jgi:hypothetical protein
MQSAQRDEEEPGSSASLTTMQSAQRDEEEPGSSASLTTMQSAQYDEEEPGRSASLTTMQSAQRDEEEPGSSARRRPSPLSAQGFDDRAEVLVAVGYCELGVDVGGVAAQRCCRAG